MNVLLTCAGRRRDIVHAFQAALRADEEVIACDSSAHAPALQEAGKSFVVPPVASDGYIDALLEICERHEIGLIVPSLEPELPKLAAQRARFLALGTLPVVSSPETVAICYDKLRTANLLAGCGLPTPATFQSPAEFAEVFAQGKVAFPVVVKPRWGVSSIATYFPQDFEELEFSFGLAHRQIARSLLAEASAADPEHCILIQEKLVGAEYGLDVINDLEGRHVCTFARRKLRMRAGQTDQAITVREERMDACGRLLGQRLAHLGLLDCDLFATERGLAVVDLNPRLGGGYSFAQAAGADYPAALLAWARGETPPARCFEMRPGVVASRSEVVLTHRSEPALPIDPVQESEPLAAAL
jgi:carbamoyl-phosphate synthase large subunit